MTAEENRGSGRKEQILESALHLFLQEGYDSTSMRNIADGAGCAVGLAYHYFETKDEMFARTLDYFFAPHEQKMQVLTAQKDKDLYALLEDCFSYMVKQISAFRKNWPEELHWTVRQALRERALKLLEASMREILNGDAVDGIWLALPVEDAAVLLGQGVGSLLLRDGEEQGHSPSREGSSKESQEEQRAQIAMRAARQILGDSLKISGTSQTLNGLIEDPSAAQISERRTARLRAEGKIFEGKEKTSGGEMQTFKGLIKLPETETEMMEEHEKMPSEWSETVVSDQPMKVNERETSGNKKEKGKKKKGKKNKQGKQK